MTLGGCWPSQATRPSYLCFLKRVASVGDRKGGRGGDQRQKVTGRGDTHTTVHTQSVDLLKNKQLEWKMAMLPNSFPGAAVTNRHRCSGLKRHKLIRSELWRPGV